MHPLLAERVPYMGTSSLLQVAWLQQSFFPGKDSNESVGIITYKKSSLVSIISGLLYQLLETWELKRNSRNTDRETFDQRWSTSPITGLWPARGSWNGNFQGCSWGTYSMQVIRRSCYMWLEDRLHICRRLWRHGIRSSCYSPRADFWAS